MAFLAAAIPAAASLAGSIIGGNAQKSAAQNAANAQLGLQNQEFQQAQQQEANYRAQIQKMLPYLGGPYQAALALNGRNQYLAPGQNEAMFGGQTLGSNGSMYLPSQMPPQYNPGPNSNYLAQGFAHGASGVPMFSPPRQAGVGYAPGISGSGMPINGQSSSEVAQRLPGIN